MYSCNANTNKSEQLDFSILCGDIQLEMYKNLEQLDDLKTGDIKSVNSHRNTLSSLPTHKCKPQQETVHDIAFHYMSTGVEV